MSITNKRTICILPYITNNLYFHHLFQPDLQNMRKIEDIEERKIIQKDKEVSGYSQTLCSLSTPIIGLTLDSLNKFCINPGG